ncbi:hypothetical protein [Salinibacter pepae]|uniref:hypothetical protein n=1 Tax=Salinibacter pepae TaxID=3040382 RepID=UPI0021E89125|nr:hypothetical protein [Salinibacter pepae]
MCRHFGYASILSIVLILASCNDSTINGFECKGKTDNLTKALGINIENISNACGGYDKKMKRSPLYIYGLPNESEHHVRSLRASAILDTVRLVNLANRYSGEALSEGENLRDYSPFNEKYQNIKSKYEHSEEWVKTGIDTTNEEGSFYGSNYYVEERWRKAKLSTEEKIDGRAEVKLQKRLIIETKSVPGKEYKESDNIYAVVLLIVRDSAYY